MILSDVRDENEPWGGRLPLLTTIVCVCMCVIISRLSTQGKPVQVKCKLVIPRCSRVAQTVTSIETMYEQITITWQSGAHIHPVLAACKSIKVPYYQMSSPNVEFSYDLQGISVRVGLFSERLWRIKRRVKFARSSGSSNQALATKCTSGSNIIGWNHVTDPLSS